LYLNGKPSYNASEAPLRYALDPDANLPLFQTITPDGKRIVFTLVQLYNPQNIADKQNRAADETLLVPAAFGEMTDEQIKNLPDIFNNGLPLILNPADRRRPMRINLDLTLVLATDGNIFKQIAADPEKAYKVGIKHPAKYVDVVANLSLMQQAANLASADSLLRGEENMIKKVVVIGADGSIHKLEEAFSLGFAEVVKSANKGIYEVVLYDEKGNIIPFSFDAALQENVEVVSP
jgi:hypothetical protein